MSSDPIEVLRTIGSELRQKCVSGGDDCEICDTQKAALDAAIASLSAPKGDLTVEELVEMLGAIVYWSEPDEVRVGMHLEAEVTGELDAAVSMLNARMAAPKPESAEAVEVAKRDGIDPWEVLIRAQKAEARAERLAEALRECVKDMQRTEDYYGEHPDAQAVISKARAALDQEGGK